MSEYVIPLTLIVTVFSVLIVVFLFVVVVSISHVRKANAIGYIRMRGKCISLLGH